MAYKKKGGHGGARRKPLLTQDQREEIKLWYKEQMQLWAGADRIVARLRVAKDQGHDGLIVHKVPKHHKLKKPRKGRREALLRKAARRFRHKFKKKGVGPRMIVRCIYGVNLKR